MSILEQLLRHVASHAFDRNTALEVSGPTWDEPLPYFLDGVAKYRATRPVAPEGYWGVVMKVGQRVLGKREKECALGSPAGPVSS